MIINKLHLILFIFAASFIAAASHPADPEKTVSIINKMRPSAVYAVLNTDAPIYSGSGENYELVGVMFKSTRVEILEDKTTAWYYVSDTDTNETGWIKGSYLDIPLSLASGTDTMASEEIESYINILGFESDTNYFTFVDIYRQKVYVLSGTKNNWKLINTITCSTGKNESPTVRGLYKISDRGVWFYSERLKSGGKFWVRFYGTYLFHSIPMDKNKNILDGTLGEKSSNGCVRMSVEDAEWFYNNVPDKTSVFIN